MPSGPVKVCRRRTATLHGTVWRRTGFPLLAPWLPLWAASVRWTAVGACERRPVVEYNWGTLRESCQVGAVLSTT